MSDVAEKDKETLYDTRPPSLDRSTLNGDAKSYAEREREGIPAAVVAPEQYLEKYDDGEFPDGGLRAWLIVFGVC